MEKVALFYPEGHQDHQLFGHPERPERIEAIKQGLVDSDLWEITSQLTPLELERSLLEEVHSP